MVPGMAGILFRELGWIVTIVVCVSTTAAISLTPMMSAYLLKLEGGQHDYKGLGVIYKPIDRALEWLDDAHPPSPRRTPTPVRSTGSYATAGSPSSR